MITTYLHYPYGTHITIETPTGHYTDGYVPDLDPPSPDSFCILS